ncbi:hypothetical protein GJ654_20400 [Rhodoblastus acidophilus]|uniref:Uncharacterized protein n=1 Tax=Rhodoblastus acidophilus TaxID=1074 RepID=A0A6N8DW27_RHOAC|nr:hypothetical protein [Rhodoblastus acidophilus]MCW2276521.1 hypothetical protein [Rhodoblastus acidophilus]MTV33341.1 hypothetical protein [Rhodoblastus acidophilus]
MNAYFKKVSIVVCILIGGLQLVGAAEISVKQNDGVSFVVSLKGEIIKGDNDRIALTFANEDLTGSWGRQVSLSLNSPEGGVFDEAMLIAKYLIDNRVSTSVDGEASCVSACGFVLLAGSREVVGEKFERSAHIDTRAHICFHRPFLKNSNGSFDEGVTAVAKLFAVLSGIVQNSFLIELLSKDRNNCKNIETVEDLMWSGLHLRAYATPQFSRIEPYIVAALNYYKIKGGVHCDVNNLPYRPVGCSSLTGEYGSKIDPVSLIDITDNNNTSNNDDNSVSLFKFDAKKRFYLQSKFNNKEIFELKMNGTLSFVYLKFQFEVGDSLSELNITVVYDSSADELFVTRGISDMTKYTSGFQIPRATRLPTYYMYPMETRIGLLVPN